ncbi:MAG: fibronectin type III domain-containing protein [Nitrospirota bacterium]|nr:fibronectin type III domain-containing protein [Nitrospirota bacterium]
MNLKFAILNITALLLLVVIVTGCGRKGSPVIPGSIAPETIAGLKAKPAPGKVSLTWTMPTKTTEGSRLKNLTTFIVQRGEVAEGTKPEDCSCTYRAIQTIDVESPSPAVIKEGKVYLDDVTVKNDTTYAYRVIAVNQYDRESRPGTPVVARPSVPPAAPTNLAAEADENQIRLSWQAPTTSEDGSPLTDLKGYNIYRSVAKGTEGGLINQQLLATTSFTDIGLESGKTYYYQVRAVDNLAQPWSESKPSSEIAASPEDRTPPMPPVTLIAVPTAKEVRLTWEPNREKDLAGYRVYRSTTPGQGYEPVTPATTAANSFVDTSVTPGNTYYYVVTAVDNSRRANESFRSEQATATIPQ